MRKSQLNEFAVMRAMGGGRERAAAKITVCAKIGAGVHFVVSGKAADPRK